MIKGVAPLSPLDASPVAKVAPNYLLDTSRGNVFLLTPLRICPDDATVRQNDLGGRRAGRKFSALQLLTARISKKDFATADLISLFARTDGPKRGN